MSGQQTDATDGLKAKMTGKRALALVQTSYPLGGLTGDEEQRALAPRETPLLARAQDGDRAAFRALFLQHSPGVRRYLGDLLRDDAAADDATQETFLRAFDTLPTLRDSTRLPSWLFGIARNVFLEHCRSHRKLALLGSEAAEESEPVDESPTPDVALLLAEADRVLLAALAHVGEPRKSALLLRLDHGLAYEDIAELMGWSIAKVKNEIHRARLQLRSQLMRYLGGSS
jgi:RNA polymerase sigma-70 factor (ECF subfamily)